LFWRSGGAVALVLLAAWPVWAADKAVPFLSGRVVDEAGMIPADARQRIEEKLAAFEKRTGIQGAVLTVDTLEGEPIEDYSVRVAQTWKLGQKGKDNGVLLLVAKQDRKIRLEVGYGLEPTLTDLATRRIIENVIRPDFQKGDFGGGIEHGVDAILSALGGGEVPAQPPGQPEGKGMPAGFLLLFVVVLGTFSLIALVSRGLQSWFLYLFLMPFYLMVPSFTGLGIGPFALVAWAVAFPILRLWIARSGMGRRFGSSPRRPWGGGGFWGGGGGFGGGGFGGGGFGGGGGGGGFSGGGGSFGGGGASGSW
jgi:uncharacterized protein